MAESLGSSVLDLTVDASDLEAGLDEAESKSESAGETSAGSFSEAFSTGLKVGGVAAAAALTKGFFDALGEEDVQNRMVNQLGVPPERAAELGATASGLYRDAWGESLGEVGDAVAAVESSLGEHLGTAGIDEISKRAIAFADTFDTDVAGAVSTAQNLITSGLAPNAEAAFDLLTRGFQEMPAALRDELTDASNEYGRFFDQLGISGEESFGLLTDAAEGGVFGIDKTGDALKELTIRSTDMSTASVEAFETAGLNAEDMAARFLEGGDSARGALSDLVDGLQGIEDPVERSNAAIALFGTPLEDLGTDQIPDFLAQLEDMGGGLGDVDGAASEMADRLAGSNSAKLRRFKRQILGGLADVAANVLVPAFEGIVDVISDVVDWFREHEDVTVALGVAVGTLVAGLTGLMIIRQVKAAIVAMRTAMLGLNLAMAANPAVLIVAAVAALAGALVLAYRKSETFRNIVDAIGRFFTDTLWPILQDVFGFLRDNVPPIIQAVIDFFTDLWHIIRDDIIPVIQRIIEVAREVLEGIGEVIGEIIEFFTGLGETILQLVTDAATWLYDVGKAVLQGLLDGITWVWDNLVKPYLELHQKILLAVGDLLGTLYDKGKDLLQGLMNGVVWIWDNVISPWLDISRKVKDTIGDLTMALFGKGLDLLRGLWDGIKWIWEHSIEGWLNIGEKVLDAIGDLSSLLYDIGEDIINGLWDGMQAAWEEVSGWVGGLGSAISGLKGPIEKDRILLVPEGQAIMEGLGTGLMAGFDDVAGQLSDITSSIPRFVVDHNLLAGQGAATAPGGGSFGDITVVAPERDAHSIVRELEWFARTGVEPPAPVVTP